MRGLGEHVESMHALKGITCLNEMFQVAGEGAWVARDVDDFRFTNGLVFPHILTKTGD